MKNSYNVDALHFFNEKNSEHVFQFLIGEKKIEKGKWFFIIIQFLI